MIDTRYKPCMDIPGCVVVAKFDAFLDESGKAQKLLWCAYWTARIVGEPEKSAIQMAIKYGGPVPRPIAEFLYPAESKRYAWIGK